VIVTSAPGSAPPLASRTLPDTWEPPTACAVAVAAVNAHSITAIPIDLIALAFPTFASTLFLEHCRVVRGQT
jgi:hypothetical protein